MILFGPPVSPASPGGLGRGGPPGGGARGGSPFSARGWGAGPEAGRGLARGQSHSWDVLQYLEPFIEGSLGTGGRSGAE